MSVQQMLWACRMTRTEAAHRLGMHPCTMHKYANGQYPVSKLVIYALRYLIAERAQRLKPEEF